MERSLRVATSYIGNYNMETKRKIDFHVKISKLILILTCNLACAEELKSDLSFVNPLLSEFFFS